MTATRSPFFRHLMKSDYGKESVRLFDEVLALSKEEQEALDNETRCYVSSVLAENSLPILRELLPDMGTGHRIELRKLGYTYQKRSATTGRWFWAKKEHVIV